MIVVTIVALVAAVVVSLGPGHGDRSAPTTAAPAAGVPYARAAGAVTLAGTGVPGFGGDGRPASASPLNAPTAVAMDAAGDLILADTGNCRIREIPAKTGVSFGLRVQAGTMVTIAGGPCTNAGADPAPGALAVDAAGDLFIAFGPGARVEEIPARSTVAFGISMAAGKPAHVAGTGSPGYGGDSGLAVHSRLDDPTGVAVDAAGDLLISDTGNCRLRLVAATSGTRFGVTVVQGHIYTVAGDGICGSAGDGGPSSNAEIWDPGALAVDAQGDVLVADQGNRTIRELAAHTGTFYGVALAADHLGTVAGEGSYGPYLTDGLSAVGQIAEINFPTAIALDGQGDLYIADGAMHAIRFVPATTTTLHGKQAQANDMYLAAGALSTGTLYNMTTWIQTRMLDPTGLALAPGNRLIYSDGLVDVVRELPPLT